MLSLKMSVLKLFCGTWLMYFSSFRTNTPDNNKNIQVDASTITNNKPENTNGKTMEQVTNLKCFTNVFNFLKASFYLCLCIIFRLFFL